MPPDHGLRPGELFLILVVDDEGAFNIKLIVIMVSRNINQITVPPKNIKGLVSSVQDHE